MRIHGSGTGATLEEAMVKVRRDLESASLHLYEIDVEKAVRLDGGKAVPDPEKYRTTNARAAELAATVVALGDHIKLRPGYIYRVLVSVGDDGAESHARIEVDLIRG